MELEPLERKVSMVQACVRGFLVRRHFQSLRAEYEAIVREIDGDLGTLQWTDGWIPTPQFPPQKAKTPWTRQAAERRADPEKAQQSRWLCNKPEKLKPTLSGESSAPTKRLPTPDARLWPQGKSRKPCREGSAHGPWMQKSGTTTPGLPNSQTELQELRSHLAMELLWLQQAINSRKEYLILKQTLRSPGAGHTRDKPSRCPDYEGQICKSPTQDDHQSSSNRTTRETDHIDDACWGFRSQPCKSPEQQATTDRSTVGSRSRDPGQRRTGPQLSTPSKNMAREPDHEKQNLGGVCQQLRNSLEDQTPTGCYEKARTQPPVVFEDPHVKDRFSGGPDHKEPDCQRARPQELGFSDDHVSWDEPLAGMPELGGLDLCGTKPPKGQTLGDESTGDRAVNVANHEGWKNQRGMPWEASPPEKRSPAA